MEKLILIGAGRMGKEVISIIGSAVAYRLGLESACWLGQDNAAKR